eukprot:jgi/Bigna1/76607/fgenesh1_pg.42_\
MPRIPEETQNSDATKARISQEARRPPEGCKLLSFKKSRSGASSAKINADSSSSSSSSTFKRSGSSVGSRGIRVLASSSPSSTSSISSSGLLRGKRSSISGKTKAVPKGRILVCVRMRPLNTEERKSQEPIAWKLSKQTVTDVLDESSYRFDYVFGPRAPTLEIYKKLVFSGKTYTTLGNSQSPGLVLHAMSDVFHYIRKTPSRQFLLRVGCIEIHNEQVNDLLGGGTDLRVEWNAKTKEVYIKGLTERFIRSSEDFIRLILKAEMRRKTAATYANERSSRSHTIFRIRIESRPRQLEKNGTRKVRCSLLSLIDLAGSECISQLPNGVKSLERELKHINRSLLGLSRVIMSLSRGKTEHVPYRDSKITRILRPALGGNSKTLFVCTLSPTETDREVQLHNFTIFGYLFLLSCDQRNDAISGYKTLKIRARNSDVSCPAIGPAMCRAVSRNSLRFGSFAQRVTNRISMNERLDEKDLIRKYKGLIVNMKRKIQKFATSIKVSKKTEAENSQLRRRNKDMLEKLEVHKKKQQELERRIDLLRKIITQAQIMQVGEGDDTSSPGTPKSEDRRTLSLSPQSTVTSPKNISAGALGMDEEDIQVVRMDLRTMQSPELGTTATTTTSSSSSIANEDTNSELSFSSSNFTYRDAVEIKSPPRRPSPRAAQAISFASQLVEPRRGQKSDGDVVRRRSSKSSSFSAFKGVVPSLRIQTGESSPRSNQEDDRVSELMKALRVLREENSGLKTVTTEEMSAEKRVQAQRLVALRNGTHLHIQAASAATEVTGNGGGGADGWGEVEAVRMWLADNKIQWTVTRASSSAAAAAGKSDQKGEGINNAACGENSNSNEESKRFCKLSDVRKLIIPGKDKEGTEKEGEVAEDAPSHTFILATKNDLKIKVIAPTSEIYHLWVLGIPPLLTAFVVQRWKLTLYRTCKNTLFSKEINVWPQACRHSSLSSGPQIHEGTNDWSSCGFIIENRKVPDGTSWIDVSTNTWNKVSLFRRLKSITDDLLDDELPTVLATTEALKKELKKHHKVMKSCAFNEFEEEWSNDSLRAVHLKNLGHLPSSSITGIKLKLPSVATSWMRAICGVGNLGKFMFSRGQCTEKDATCDACGILKDMDHLLQCPTHSREQIRLRNQMSAIMNRNDDTNRLTKAEKDSRTAARSARQHRSHEDAFKCMKHVVAETNRCNIGAVAAALHSYIRMTLEKI